MGGGGNESPVTIRRLPENLVNRIAAGEVVERPAAAVKELVENALDAGARHIDVELREGGRSFISVTDDGRGMTAEEIELAIQRHATSKLPGDDLVHIATLGFRGEALPSIGAVSRLTVTSRTNVGGAGRAGDVGGASPQAWSLVVEGGKQGALKPAAHPPGTRVEVRDPIHPAPGSRCATCSTPPRRGSSSSRPRAPKPTTRSTRCGAWPWPIPGSASPWPRMAAACCVWHPRRASCSPRA
jgi:DNA mismatch repair protein MutL